MIAAQGSSKGMEDRTKPWLELMGITGKAAGEKSIEDFCAAFGKGF